MVVLGRWMAAARSEQLSRIRVASVFDGEKLAFRAMFEDETQGVYIARVGGTAGAQPCACDFDGCGLGVRPLTSSRTA